MARVGRAAALAVLVLCISGIAVSAKKEHVKVLLGQTEFEEAIKVRVYGTVLWLQTGLWHMHLHASHGSWRIGDGRGELWTRNAMHCMAGPIRQTIAM